MWRDRELERVACDLCLSTSSQPLFRRPDGLIVEQCPSCGLCFVNPRPHDEHVRRLYEEGYFAANVGDPTVGYGDYLSPASREKLALRACIRLNLTRQVVPLEGRRVLEVGCATGELCALIERAGAETTGIDLAEDVVSEARRRHPGVRLLVTSVADLPPEELFDVVLAFEVVEHVPSPRRFLDDLASRLRPGGVLGLSTPNLERGRAVGWERWIGFHNSLEHLYFLSVDHLESYGSKVGLETVAWFTGAGTGAVTPAESRRPDLFRRLAARSGLMPVARALRRRLSLARLSLVCPRGEVGDYRPGGDRHNVVIFFRKPAG